MRRFTLSIEWGDVPSDPPTPADLDSLVERSDPDRPASHDLDARPLEAGFAPARGVRDAS